MKMEALVQISVPGTVYEIRNHSIIERFQSLLDANNIKHNIVDTVPGWGCLNQEWVEFETEIDSSWGWAEFNKMPNDGKDGFSAEYIKKLLHEGKLIMMLMVKHQGSWVTYS